MAGAKPEKPDLQRQANLSPATMMAPELPRVF